MGTQTAVPEPQISSEILARLAAIRESVDGRIPPRDRGLVSADDILQDTLLAAHCRATSLRMLSHEEMQRWLATVARSKLIDALRHARRLRRGGGVHFVVRASLFLARLRSPRKTPSADARAKEARERLNEALGQLSESQKRVIEMRFFGAQSRSQIAAELHISPGSVKSQLSKGLRKLRVLLAAQ